MDYMIVNPRRRRGGKKAKRARARGGKRRRRNPSMFLKRRSRRRRNPAGFGGIKLPKLAGLNLGSAVAGAVGVVAADKLTGMVANMVPVDFLKSGVGRIGLKIGVSAAALMIARKALGPKAAADLSAGMGISVALDAYKLASSKIGSLPQLGALVPSLDGITDDDDSVSIGSLAEPAFATPW